MSAHPPILSVVVPCFNEEEVLPETARRLDELFHRLIDEGMVDPQSRVYFVDDGSRDLTWSLIGGLHRGNPRFGGIKLSRNRGHQNALLAGLLSVPGDMVLSIDADLQDDLTAIERMLQAAAGGADIVFGVRSDRSSDTFFKRMTAQGYYSLIGKLGVEIVSNHADFRLMSRRAIEALRDYNETNLFLRALIIQLGFATAIVTYERSERFAGTSKYPLRKMLSLAVQGVTSFSIQPLRAITWLGLAVSIVSFLLGIWALLSALTLGSTVSGWASTVIPIYMICGVQMLCLGIIGEYIGKIYIETKRRPRFHIEAALGGAEVYAGGRLDLADKPLTRVES
ncbi:glycosyltransferase [Rhodopseudomonas palustris]|uniref:Glycosyltransferase n=1 Tax=Rhodopseudomonas palustris TaxID=1076 RepID=A0A323UDA2_RHOPL|nr:glycosyltransferase family 2 protein [Rhodopseudomonas palustris]PZA09410.1 glycosyltransferase [Rhodopseudomonas palustris]